MPMSSCIISASTPVRYFVLHEMPFAQDGTITWDLMVERVNADLANILAICQPDHLYVQQVISAVSYPIRRSASRWMMN